MNGSSVYGEVLQKISSSENSRRQKQILSVYEPQKDELLLSPGLEGMKVFFITVNGVRFIILCI